MKRMKFWFLWGVLIAAGCASTPQYSGVRSGPLKDIRLGIVYTEGTKKEFDSIKAHQKLPHVAINPWLKASPSEVTQGLETALHPHFKSVDRYPNFNAALKAGADLVMSYDFYCTISEGPGQPTTLGMTGRFLDRGEQPIDSVKADGSSTIFSWLFREALGRSFKQFTSRINNSAALGEFAKKEPVPLPPRNVKPITQSAKPREGGYYDKSWAVVIGINDYDTWPALEFAVNDARAVKKKLEALGFDEVIEILDKDATRARILSLLGTELRKKVGPEDRVVIFFAGHGQTETLGEGKERGYIIPVDGSITDYFTTAISMTQVRELSQRIPAKHLLYMMDACYSGLGFTRAAGLNPIIDGYIKKITSMRSVQMITAGGKGEQVMEINGHGVFTQYILRGLDGEADRDNDGLVTASELGSFVKPQVSRATDNHQTPQYGRLDGEGDVVFIVSPSA